MLATKWNCTKCEDITKYLLVLKQNHIDGETAIDATQRKVLERILLELYCQNIYSEFFRDCPNKIIVRQTYYLTCVKSY